MLENEQKGWHGAYSIIGKYSAEKYHIITHKDEILSRKTSLNDRSTITNFLRRNGYHNIFGENKPKISESLDDSQLDIIEDNIDIFQLDSKKPIAQENIKKGKIMNKDFSRPFTAYHRTNKEAFKYHDKHMSERKKKRIESTPDCTKYVPNKNVVWKRTLIGPPWKTMKERQSLGHQDNTKYYLEHNDPLKNITPTFINMDKQTQRGTFFSVSSPRFNSAKAFTPIIKRRRFSSFSKVSFSEENNNNSESGLISQKSTKIIKNTISSKKSKNESKISEKEEEEENDDFELDINEKINKELNDKWKRGFSGTSRPTRPGTARPVSVTTTFSSRPTTTNNNKITNSNVNTSEIISLDGEEVKNENDLNSSSSESKDSYEEFRYIYEKQIKRKSNNNYTNSKLSFSKNNNNINYVKNPKIKSKKEPNKNKERKRRPQTTIKRRKNTYIKTIDFDKIISREYLENIADKKKSLIPFSLPNFKQVRERPIMMVVYDRVRHLKNKPKEIQGIEPSMYSDPYINLDKINNHISVNPPNFDRISSRPYDNNPLPSYMKKNFTGEAVYSLTDQSLKMNNYTNGKFIKNYTSFWPKKTYNKIINLNLLNSDAFINNVIGDKKKLEKENNYIAKSMKFYNKNYDDLMKEGMLHRFDNVTYKTIKKENRFDQKDMEKFLRNYQSNNH